MPDEGLLDSHGNDAIVSNTLKTSPVTFSLWGRESRGWHFKYQVDAVIYTYTSGKWPHGCEYSQIKLDVNWEHLHIN